LFAKLTTTATTGTRERGFSVGNFISVHHLLLGYTATLSLVYYHNYSVVHKYW